MKRTTTETTGIDARVPESAVLVNKDSTTDYASSEVGDTTASGRI